MKKKSDINVQRIYKKKTLRVRILHQKGLTVSEIAKEIDETKDFVEIVLNHIGLKPKYEHRKFEGSEFYNSLSKQVKI